MSTQKTKYVRTEKPPFSRGYVLRLTLSNMKRDLKLSIEKTLGRLPEFEGNSAKSEELLSTLSVLHAMDNMLNEFEQHNSGLFQG